jgi:hypothetical protein
VKRSLFRDRQEFAVVVPFLGGNTGVIATVPIDKTRKEYKLGKIVRVNRPVR